MKEVLETKTNDTEKLSTTEKEISNMEQVDLGEMAAKALAADVESKALAVADKAHVDKGVAEAREGIEKIAKPEKVKLNLSSAQEVVAAIYAEKKATTEQYNNKMSEENSKRNIFQKIGHYMTHGNESSYGSKEGYKANMNRRNEVELQAFETAKKMGLSDLEAMKLMDVSESDLPKNRFDSLVAKKIMDSHASEVPKDENGQWNHEDVIKAKKAGQEDIEKARPEYDAIDLNDPKFDSVKKQINKILENKKNFREYVNS